MAASLTKLMSGRSMYLLLCALVISIIINGLTMQRIHHEVAVDDSHYSYLDDDHPTELPIHLNAVAMTFEDYAPNKMFSQTGRFAWADWHATDHFPKGHGFVRIGPNDREFAVAMFHQIHCLDMIRESLIHGPNGHSGHCLNFLRQGALCNADITLETGAEVTHVCRDWRQVYDFITENQKHWKEIAKD